MTAKKIAILLTTCLLLLAYSAQLLAQCKVTRECYLGICDFPIPPSATCGNPGGGINGYFCTWSTDQCPVTTTTCTRCTHSASPSPPEGGAPINLATGDVYVGQADVAIPGLGGGMSLFRTWNSILPPLSGASSSGMFGLHWRSNFEERISLGSDGLFKYFLGNGDVWSFGYSGYDSGSSRFLYDLAAPANGNTSFKLDSTVWTITYKDGGSKTFDPTTGVLKTIADRNGNTAVLSYDGSNRLVTVTDPAGRHLYFAYGTGNASYLVNGVTSDFGIALSYAYDSQGRLTSVTRPDTTTISFEYNTQSLITAVKDSDSKVLESHTYDSQGRGLTSSRANGVEAISVSYEKPAPPTGP